jgi:hypothetical protein
MRKVVFAVVALVALMLTSLAVAEGIEGAKSAKSVAATFSATAGTTTTRTCTTTDGKTIVVTDGKYTGTAAGDPDLTGAITLRARSVVNTTDKVGVVDGRYMIDVANGKNTAGSYSSVYNDGSIAGLAVGRAHQPNAKLVANLSATFDAATGFTNGKLGGGTSGGNAVEIGPGSCKPAKPTAEKSEAHGTVTALSSDSITVAGLTCAVPADKSADVNAKLKTGDVAQIRCALVSGTNTLVSFEGKKKH